MVSQLTRLEQESIDYFVSFVQIFGLPKSVGQIYGLMFVSVDPMPMSHIIERLEMSKGSASQGLATLRSLGAVVLDLHRNDPVKEAIISFQENRDVVFRKTPQTSCSAVPFPLNENP